MRQQAIPSMPSETASRSSRYSVMSSHLQAAGRSIGTRSISCCSQCVTWPETYRTSFCTPVPRSTRVTASNPFRSSNVLWCATESTSTQKSRSSTKYTVGREPAGGCVRSSNSRSTNICSVSESSRNTPTSIAHRSPTSSLHDRLSKLSPCNMLTAVSISGIR